MSKRERDLLLLSIKKVILSTKFFKKNSHHSTIYKLLNCKFAHYKKV